MMTLQDRVERLRAGPFLGVPIDDFELGGREQLLFLIANGMAPDSTLVDLGCGVLRGGYWTIHFLDADHYFGIETHAERLRIGMTEIVGEETLRAKRPRFDSNPDFDTSVFKTKLDYFIAYSIWTHASKRQIAMMLDSFVRDSHQESVFLATVLPADRRNADYTGESWVGTSHESDQPGRVFHRIGWIETECSRRGLAIRSLGPDATQGQLWLRITHRGSRTADAELRLMSRGTSLWKRIVRRAQSLIRRSSSPRRQ